MILKASRYVSKATLLVIGLVLLVLFVFNFYGTHTERFVPEYGTVPFDPRLAWITERGTRNMSYDLRGDPAQNEIRPFIWNNSPIAAREAVHQLSLDRFKKYSSGLTIGGRPLKTAPGWPEISDVTSGWVDPTVLDESNWNDYTLVF